MKCRNTMCDWMKRGFCRKNARNYVYARQVEIKACSLRKKFNRIMSDWYKSTKRPLGELCFLSKFLERIRED